MIKIKEELLHYIWKTKNFDPLDLSTANGKPLTILDFGQYNHNAGPDFLHGKILVGDTIWHGHIEIHIKASDWISHRHSSDKKYENVVLHVVYKNDVTITLKDGTEIPCLELKSRIRRDVIDNYDQMIASHKWIACEDYISSVNLITKVSTLDKMIAERLTCRSKDILEELEKNNFDFLTITYQRLARAFGSNVNGAAMHRLATLVPFKIVLKHRDNLEHLEALLFGVSGLLPEKGNDEYQEKLIDHFRFYKSKYQLIQMSEVEWKFSRMRPSNFPTLRIAQLAKYLYDNPRIDDFLEIKSISHLSEKLQVILDGYWNTHYNFKSSSDYRIKKLGKRSINSILINWAAPILFAYGIYYQDELMKKRAIDILDFCPAEHNSIIQKWKEIGFTNENASDSQALLHLKKSFCEKQRCLSCPIGHAVISS